MINLARVLRAPFIRQSLRIYRSEGHFGQGGWIEDIPSPAYFDVDGGAWPSTAKEIEQVPEADRVQGMHTFASETELFVTHTSGIPGTSDQIEWKSERYKLIQILNFGDYGFHVAVGARLSGD
jgi:hypothetical protein